MYSALVRALRALEKFDTKKAIAVYFGTFTLYAIMPEKLWVLRPGIEIAMILEFWTIFVSLALKLRNDFLQVDWTTVAERETNNPS